MQTGCHAEENSHALARTARAFCSAAAGDISTGRDEVLLTRAKSACDRLESLCRLAGDTAKSPSRCQELALAVCEVVSSTAPFAKTWTAAAEDARAGLIQGASAALREVERLLGPDESIGHVESHPS
jgi:hypothetical protein